MARSVRNNTAFVEKTIAQARKDWGYDEQWVILWKFSKQAKEDGGGCIDCEPYGEKGIRLELSVDYKDSRDFERIRRDIYHELGHPVVAPIWRASVDWAKHLIVPPEGKLRDIFEENINTAENLVIDHIVTQIIFRKNGK